MKKEIYFHLNYSNMMIIYQIRKNFALNEILIQRGSLSKMICLIIFMDNEPLTEVFCDGLIFSSPTISTAYSLSAWGPLLYYEVEWLVLSSLCHFSLSFRPSYS